MKTRVGIGYDIHALRKGRKLILGGVSIPFAKGLVGHSDADALLHAVVDAILGALGEGDMGEHFPDTDPRFKNKDSQHFVNEVKKILVRKKMRIENIDSVVVAELPKLAPYKDRMKASLAKAFGVSLSAVSVKAKTNEGFGALGRNEAIACHAIVSLTQRSR